MGNQITSKSFWTSLRGVIIAISSLITAIAGLIAALYAIGIFESCSPPPTAENIVTSITVAPPKLANSTTAKFVFTSNEEGCSFECLLDEGDWEPCTCTKTYYDLEEGEHVFRVRATDRAGNVEVTQAEHTWEIDITPPETEIDDMPLTPTNSAIAEFKFTADEEGCSFECSLDGEPWEPCIIPNKKEYYNLEEGGHVFRVRATDRAGNVEVTQAEHTWEVDTTPPETTIDDPWESYYPHFGTAVTFEFTSNEDGCSFECSLDRGDWRECSSPKTYYNLGEGEHVFRVRATDQAGNVEEEEHYEYNEKIFEFEDLGEYPGNGDVKI